MIIYMYILFYSNIYLIFFFFLDFEWSKEYIDFHFQTID